MLGQLPFPVDTLLVIVGGHNPMGLLDSPLCLPLNKSHFIAHCTGFSCKESLWQEGRLAAGSGMQRVNVLLTELAVT